MAPRPKHNPRFNFVDAGSEKLLYDSATHNVIYLDAPGAMVWALCNGERDVEEIVRLLAEAYPNQQQAIDDDVRKTIETLTDQGPLTLV